MLKYFFIFYLFSGRHELSSGNPLLGLNVEKAKYEDFRFIVSIGRDHFCTGVLISLEHVLTSEHCLEYEKISKLQVRVGSNDLKAGALYNVSSAITYRDWSIKHNEVSLNYNDIAILKLSKNVTETWVRISHITNETDESAFYGKTAVTAGWGGTNGDMHPRFLRTASLQILTPKKCSKNIFFIQREVIDQLEGLLCTKAEPYVVLGCGDSGGPLLIDNEIIGINESSYPDCNDRREADQNFHVSITYYTEFIRDVLTT